MAHTLRNPQWLGIDRDMWLTGTIVIGSILNGMGAVLMFHVPKFAAAFMWTLACLSVGSLLGLLFGVPRAASSPPSDTSTGSRALSANTNIEQISDWLTKLLVGVGLVELKELPGGLSAAAHFVAAGLGNASPNNDPQLVPFAAALIIFFLVEGFLGGYLATRIFFQRVFERSDRDLSG